MIRLDRSLIQCPSDDFDTRLAALRGKLQKAIELEHSTIPPYLYALYSIKTNSNLEIAALMLSVIKQEMLHMSLVCNVLNAVGGAPRIDDPAFIPSYPGHLPGGVEAGLVVPLAPLSKQVVRDVFMVIEAPDHTLDGDPPSDEGITIGQFYRHLQAEIVVLNHQRDIFTGDRARQLRVGFAELQDAGVIDQATALRAIETIIDQGEGTRVSPFDGEHELSHYYRFAEIYHGRALVTNPDPQAGSPPWLFIGHPIRFDPAGVQPVIVNPSSASYHSHPQLAELNNGFNRGYSDLLRKLHRVFNGQPDWLGPALLEMQALKQQARLLMSREIVPGQTAGPTFDYLPA